jgi:gluconate 2-dehydrogenase gamma chain
LVQQKNQSIPFPLDPIRIASYIPRIVSSTEEILNLLPSAKSRRDFLLHSLGGASSVWIAAHWPALLSAATHARDTVNSSEPPKFDFLSAEQAAEIGAVSARIIPTTDTPGAREAGVIYFIDRALVTFAKDQQKTCIDGLADLQARVAETFSGAAKFSALTPDQQDQILHALDEQAASSGRGGRRNRGAASSFFETIRVATIAGFLIDPDSGRGGNRDAVGWKVIGRDPAHMFQPPFGFYDKDYPGYQLHPPANGKAGS